MSSTQCSFQCHSPECISSLCYAGSADALFTLHAGTMGPLPSPCSRAALFSSTYPEYVTGFVTCRWASMMFMVPSSLFPATKYVRSSPVVGCGLSLSLDVATRPIEPGGGRQSSWIGLSLLSADRGMKSAHLQAQPSSRPSCFWPQVISLSAWLRSPES